MKYILRNALFMSAIFLMLCAGTARAQSDSLSNIQDTSGVQSGTKLVIPVAVPVPTQSDSLLDDLDVEEPKDEPVEYTFKDQRLINFHTVEVGGKRTLDFRISHRFGDVSEGPSTFFGLDGPASIFLGLEYSYDGRLQFGIGRVNVNKMINGFLKYRLLYQRKDNSMPVSVTLFAEMNQAGVRNDPTVQNLDLYTSRLNYVYQVMIARKFTNNFSFQISPTFIHFNLVDSADDKNDLFAIPILARYKFNARMAITAEYAVRLTKYLPVTFTSEDPFTNCASLGVEIETGGHVFSMFLTNAFGINEAQTIPYTRGRWWDGDIKIGFNISRVFRL